MYPNWQYAPINKPISHSLLSLFRLQGLLFLHTIKLLHSIKTSRGDSHVRFLRFVQASEIGSIRITARRCVSATSHDRHTETILLEYNSSISFRIKSRSVKAYLASSALVYISTWKVWDSVFRRSFQVFCSAIFIFWHCYSYFFCCTLINFFLGGGPFCLRSPRWEKGSV
jgi:hypothetical protein